MRFNDQLQTVLSATTDGDAAALTVWRQCVDLLAQHDRPGSDLLDRAGRDALIARLSALTARVPEHRRVSAVVELGSRLRSPALVRLFAADRPAVIDAAFSRARLADIVWPGIIPGIGPMARGVLRGRRDLGLNARRALDAYGSVDFVLDGTRAPVPIPAVTTPDVAAPPKPMPETRVPPARPDLPRPDVETASPAPVEPAEAPSLASLVDRINAFTDARRRTGTQAPALVPASDGSLMFETDVEGRIVAGDPALLDLSIADTGGGVSGGPDGQAAGAFRSRDAVRGGRFTIRGDGPHAGAWRMTATPLFDPGLGRFLGYSGTLRRPHLHEVPAMEDTSSAPAQIFGADMPADSVRQLVHELRTPLNAILGFAEIIEQQMFGPAAARYRVLAGDIIADARRLLGAFDDLDLASRIERGDADPHPESVDTAALVAAIAARFRVAGHALDIRVGPEVPFVRLDPGQAERLVQHFLRSLVSVAAKGEALHGACLHTADMRGGPGHVILSLERPQALLGLEEQDLLDPGYGPAGESPDAPILGLGFSLRLVRSIAEGVGGRLTVDPDRFLLRLPAALDDEASAGEG